MSTPQVRRTPGVREELHAPRLTAVSVRGLSCSGSADADADPIAGVDLDILAGTLSFVTPSRPARTVALCLTGALTPDSGTILVPSPPDGELSAPGDAWQATAAHLDPDDASEVQAVLARFGRPADRVARRFGLNAPGTRRVKDLPWHLAILLSVAAALDRTPDVLTVDASTGELRDEEGEAMVAGLRELVDLEGRTIILTLDAGPAATHQRYADNMVSLGPRSNGPAPATTRTRGTQ